MDSQTHVIVVGAGIVGASVAWNLVRHGATVTIIAPEVGGTATRDSFAWLNATWQNTRVYYDFRRRSMEAWKRLTQEVAGLSDLVQWCGSIQWDMPAEELTRFEKEHRKWGYDIHRIEKKEMHKLEPCLAQEIFPNWALRIGEEGTVEAAAAAELLVTDARARGAQLLTTSVSSLLLEEGCIKGIVLESGEKKLADHVVIAAGVGSKQLCATAGVDLPADSRAGLLVHSKPVPKRLLNGLVLAPGLHMRQTVEGRVVAGAGYAGSDAGDDPEETARAVFARCKGLFSPEAADEDALQMDHFTVGIRPMPADGLPILGNAGPKGLSLAIMHSGVTLAAIVGELLANHIFNGKEDATFEGFGISRFERDATKE